MQLAVKIPLKENYKNEISKIKKYIKKYRKDLLEDKETYPRLKAFLLASYFGLRAIKLTEILINISKIIRK